MAWGPLAGIGGKINAGANGLWGGIGHGLGWAGGQVAAGAGTFLQSWGGALGKVYGWAIPNVGGTVAKGGASLLGSWGGGLTKLLGAKGGLGWKVLGGIGAAGLAAVWLVGKVARVLAYPQRTAARMTRTITTPRGKHVMTTVHSTGSGGGFGKIAVVLLLVWLLLPHASPATAPLLRGGAQGYTVQPASSTCATPASLPQGGMTGIASWLGNRLRTLPTTPPDAHAQADSMRAGIRRVGGWWQTFQNALHGTTAPDLPAPTPDLAAQVGYCGGCPTGGSGVLPASYRNDSLAETAARAALAVGATGDTALTMVAIAGAESNYVPTATNRNTNGTTDWGLWQVNDVHADLLAAAGTAWSDPMTNARMAWSISGQGRTWQPWTTYNSGAYRAHLLEARDALAAVQAGGTAPVACTTPTSAGPGSPTVEAAIAFAMQQLGEPYQWGATGPDSWDCSGLVGKAYNLPGRPTTATLINMGTAVVPGQEQRGDLIFPDSGHVGIALGDGTYINAPHTGAVVRIEKPWAVWQVRRLGPVSTA